VSFAAVVIAMRVLIAWLYANSGSVLGAQLMHASSTGFLVVLSPPGVSPSQEAMWYLVYAAVLWAVVGVVVAHYGASLTGVSRRMREAASAPDAGDAVATA
jgi:ABC-type sugar transport system permease subunit